MSEMMRRKFTPDYRVRAARLVMDTGRSIVSVAEGDRGFCWFFG